jgi:hypothetical protein
MRMSETQESELILTVQQLAAEVARLCERVEDLEDSKELDAAIGRNGEKPLIPWERAKDELGLSGIRGFVMSPIHQRSNVESWEAIQSFIEKFPDNTQWRPWKILARSFVKECYRFGLNRYFRAGQSMHYLTFSTLDHRGLGNEPRVVVEFFPHNEVRIIYHRRAAVELEYTLPLDSGFATFRRFLNQLWTNTMPEGIPADLRGPIAPLVAPILTPCRR